MVIIIGIIVGVFVLAGTILLVRANKSKEKTVEKEEVSAPASDCCGAHEVCEFDKMKVDEKIVEYYDDEELDAYKDVNEKEYTSNQIEQFREVLYTLKTEEIMLWLLSLERRHIQLPAILQSEARFLIADG